MTIQLPGIGAPPVPSPVYIDGIPLGLASPANSPAGRLNRANDYWSSVPRPAWSQIEDELYVSLPKPRQINYITFDIAHFPQVFSLWWLIGEGNSTDADDWKPVCYKNGTPITIAITNSIPRVVGSPAAMAAGTNPYHYGAGHWDHYDELIQPITTTQLKFVGLRAGAARLPTWSAPVDPAGNAVPYPLGIRDLDFGYRVLDRDDVPYTPRSPSTVTERTPFTTTNDVHGSSMTVSVRENRASDLLQGYTWSSAPQLRQDSVVNLYIDSRDPTGNPQVIGGFDITPVTSGAKFNLYYSPDPPPSSTTFSGVDTPIVAPAIQAGGAQIPATSTDGITFGNVSSWLQISTQVSGITGSSPWWVASAFQPQFAHTDAGSYVLADAGIFQVYFQAGTFYMSLCNGKVVTQLGTWAFPFLVNDQIIFSVVFDGANLVATMWWQQWYPVAVVPVATLPNVPAFLLGAALPATQTTTGGPSWASMNGNYMLTAMAIGQEQLNMIGQIDPVMVRFANSPGAFINPGQAGPANVLARFHPSFILPPTLIVENSTTSINPWGFVGGAADSYASCTWIPILQDFVLAQGLVEFDPQLACVFKFEFTSLVAKSYDFLQPVSLNTKIMPASPANLPPQLVAPRPAVLELGQQVTQALAPTVAFSDVPPPPQPFPQNTTLPRQAMYAVTPAGAAQLSQAGSLYNFQPFKPATVTPTQTVSGVHNYGASAYPPSGRVAYFVAISSLTMYRVSYQVQDDTEEYTELFQDQQNFTLGAASGPTQAQWYWTAGQLTTGIDFLNLTGVATATSAIFPSNTTVIGVQFATTQSDAVQMLPDPSFAQPNLPTWAPVGDVPGLPIATGILSALGNMVQISRSPTAYSWALLQQQFTTWSTLQTTIGKWSGFVIKPAGSLTGGIAGTVPQQTTAAGRVYAAARVFSPVALTQPLALQILDGATGAVLAEADDPVAGGQVTEWFVGYTIGSANYSQALTWTQVMATYPTWASTAQNPNSAFTTPNLWNQIDLVIYPLGQTLIPQLIQRGITEDTWYLDNLSMFEDPIVWSFSNDGGASWYQAPDIKNNPSGALVFGPPQQGTGNQLMWKLQGYRPDLTVSSLAIRPWYSVFPRGYPARQGGVGHGPNLHPLDLYPPIDSDPRWQAWDSPIPQTWFFTYQQLLGSQQGYSAPVTPVTVPQLPIAVAGSNVIALSAASQVPPAPPVPATYLDLYLDTYIDYYGTGASGDLYTDTYDDIYAYQAPPVTGTMHSSGGSWTQGSVFSAGATHKAPGPPLLGAFVGNGNGNSQAVQDFITATGQPLALRRLYLGNQIPASLAASPAAYDAQAGRKVFFDFTPDTSNTPAQLSTFLASCQAGGLKASVSLWSNPDASFSNPLDFFEMLQSYVPIIQANGYQYVFVISNNTVARKNGLPVWWPQPYVQVDALSVSLISTGITPGDPGADNLSTAAHWADVNQVPIGLAEFSADWSKISDARGEDFLEWIQDFVYARVHAGKPVGDLVIQSTGSNSLANAPHDWKTGYTYIGRALQGVNIDID